MDEPVRWVSKAEASQELEISLLTLDQRIRKGEVKAVREGRRVFVRIHGPEYLSDDEVLERTIFDLDESERSVRELERAASEMERERDEARVAVSASREAYEELEEAYRRGRAAHYRTRRMALRLGLAAAALFVLLVVSVLVAWQLIT